MNAPAEQAGRDSKKMNPPALAFGLLLPYIRNHEEFEGAISTWIRSHFFYQRAIRPLRWNSEEPTPPPSPPKWDESTKSAVATISINYKAPHGQQCFVSGFVLMTGSRSMEDMRLLMTLANRCSQGLKGREGEEYREWRPKG